MPKLRWQPLRMKRPTTVRLHLKHLNTFIKRISSHVQSEDFPHLPTTTSLDLSKCSQRCSKLATRALTHLPHLYFDCYGGPCLSLTVDSSPQWSKRSVHRHLILVRFKLCRCLCVEIDLTASSWLRSRLLPRSAVGLWRCCLGFGEEREGIEYLGS